MIRTLALAAALCVAALAPAGAQAAEVPPVTYPALPAMADSAAGFVPQGWVIESQIKGDLDKDGHDDLTLVLKMADPANILKKFEDSDATYDTNPRILAVALAGPDGDYRLAVANHTFIPRLTNSSQEDPLSETGGVSFDNGSIRVSLYLFMSAGGWDAGNTSYRFRMEKNRLRLIGYDSYNVHRGSGAVDEVSINLLTGKVIVKTGNISEDEMKTTVKKLRKNPVLTIDDLGEAGERFDPRY